jgi:hypothetical protein
VLLSIIGHFFLRGLSSSSSSLSELLELLLLLLFWERVAALLGEVLGVQSQQQ